MKKEELESGNKLIAEFMGAKWHEHPINKDESEFIFPISPDPSSTLKQRINLRYHSEWNWLMPVVKKCLTVGDNSDMWDILFNALSMVEIDSLFGAVVDFIKWYNKTSKIMAIFRVREERPAVAVWEYNVEAGSEEEAISIVDDGSVESVNNYTNIDFEAEATITIEK